MAMIIIFVVYYVLGVLITLKVIYDTALNTAVDLPWYDWMVIITFMAIVVPAIYVVSKILHVIDYLIFKITN